MTTNTATTNNVTDFVKHLLNNPHERERLQDATAAEIVQAGKDAGYDFTISDLNALISQTTVPSMVTVWDEVGVGC